MNAPLTHGMRNVTAFCPEFPLSSAIEIYAARYIAPYAIDFLDCAMLQAQPELIPEGPLPQSRGVCLPGGSAADR